jgi:hypothetical protein
MQSTTNGWNKYQKLILFRLDEQDAKLESIQEKVEQLNESMTLVKFKMALIGAGSGAVSAALLSAVVKWALR